MVSGRVGSDRIGAWRRDPSQSLSALPTRRCRQPVMEANHMSTRIARVEPAVTVIVGVDTHKHVHVAVAVDRLGARLGSCSVPVNRGGYAELVAWARTLGTVEAFGIEGTGSYGVGLASVVRRHAGRVVEVNHCDRRTRRNTGKSDTIDAEMAARSVLAGIATAVPKSAHSRHAGSRSRPKSLPMTRRLIASLGPPRRRYVRRSGSVQTHAPR